MRPPYAYSFKEVFFDWIQGTWRVFPSGSQPEKEIKEGRLSLDWAAVDPLAHRGFTLWPGQPELIWARESWGLVLKYGLADYANDFERWGVLFRFLALAGIYYDFCHLAWNRVNWPDYETLGKELGLGLLQVVMLLGQDALLEQVTDEEELFRVGMKSLADQARIRDRSRPDSGLRREQVPVRGLSPEPAVGALTGGQRTNHPVLPTGRLALAGRRLSGFPLRRAARSIDVIRMKRFHGHDGRFSPSPSCLVMSGLTLLYRQPFREPGGTVGRSAENTTSFALDARRLSWSRAKGWRSGFLWNWPGA